MKRGQSMPLNVVIIAVILLIVLIVVAVIFVKRMNDGNNTLSSCGIAGKCMSSCGEGFIDVPEQKCPSGQKCCMKVTDEKSPT
jgi:hypothetical protein